MIYIFLAKSYFYPTIAVSLQTYGPTVNYFYRTIRRVHSCFFEYSSSAKGQRQSKGQFQRSWSNRHGWKREEYWKRSNHCFFPIRYAHERYRNLYLCSTRFTYRETGTIATVLAIVRSSVIILGQFRYLRINISNGRESSVQIELSRCPSTHSLDFTSIMEQTSVSRFFEANEIIDETIRERKAELSVTKLA